MIVLLIVRPLFYFVLARVGLESLIATIRTAETTGELVRRAGGSVPGGVTPPPNHPPSYAGFGLSPSIPRSTMTYELRTYTANPGKMDALMERFRSNTIALFTEHNMKSLGYWVPVDQPDVLIYLLQHDGDPVTNWTAFASDQRWTDAKAASEVDGALTASIESVFLEATDLHPIAGA